MCVKHLMTILSYFKFTGVVPFKDTFNFFSTTVQREIFYIYLTLLVISFFFIYIYIYVRP